LQKDRPRSRLTVDEAVKLYALLILLVLYAAPHSVGSAKI